MGVVQLERQAINRPANQNMGQSAVFVLVLNMCVAVHMRSPIPSNGRGSSSKRTRHIKIHFFCMIASKEVK
jgi:hypothetical protein